MGSAKFRLPTCDPYQVLELPATARLEEIRAVYKREMLKAHPDKNPRRRIWAERRVRELNEAFEILSNAERRATFDIYRSRIDPGARSRSFRFRKADADQPRPFYFTRSDPPARARLILHHLLHRKPGAAMRILAEMEAVQGTEFLAANLEDEDCLDCLFLLGEILAARRQYVKAAVRLRAFLEKERLTRTLRHYHSQAVELLKDLYLRKLPGRATIEVAIQGLEAAVELGLSGAEEILRLRRLVEIQVKRGDLSAARILLARAERLSPLSKDTQRIRNTIQAAG